MTDTPSTAQLTRQYDGLELPAPGTFAADKAHSQVGFMVRHMMIAKVRGRFSTFEGTLVVPEDPLQSTLEVDVETASIDTRDADRDTHLRSPDFLDAETFPAMTFRSTGITRQGATELRVDGDLTIRDTTRPVTLEASFEGVAPDPWGNQRVAFSATAEINREDWGLTWNQTLETGGVLVGKQIKLEIEAEFVRQQ